LLASTQSFFFFEAAIVRSISGCATIHGGSVRLQMIVDPGSL
jgi:hypothetical protein